MTLTRVAMSNRSKAVVKGVIHHLQGEHCKDKGEDIVNKDSVASNGTSAKQDHTEAVNFLDAALCRFEDLKAGTCKQ